MALPREILCQICDDPHDATHRCIECEEDMCNSVVLVHRSAKKTKHHQLISLTPQSSSSSQVISSKIQRCARHNEIINLFCQQDQIPVCSSCLQDHKSHQFLHLETVFEEKRQLLSPLLSKADDLLKQINKDHKQIITTKEEIDKQQITIRQQTVEYFETMAKLMKKKRCRIVKD